MTPRVMPNRLCIASAASIVASGVQYTAPGRIGYLSTGPKTWNWLSHEFAGGSGCGALG
jgi:hypothetical protein